MTPCAKLTSPVCTLQLQMYMPWTKRGRLTPVFARCKRSKPIEMTTEQNSTLAAIEQSHAGGAG